MRSLSYGPVQQVNLATVKTTASGFANGDMYFGNDTNVGWLSADGTTSNLNWCILTNETFVNPLKLRGSLYVDRTGTFSNNLVVVTSDEDYVPGEKGVWLVQSNGQPKLLASINTRHLEGVITLTNDVDRWGPWAGKIVTGDEAAQDQTGLSRPLVYTVATNGAVASYALPGVHPEDFDIVPPNQDLYCVNYRSDGGRILKVSRALLTDYVGDLLITDAGEDAPNYVAKLALIRWDSTNANFVVRTIPFPDSSGDNHLEHVTFAPTDLPPLTP